FVGRFPTRITQKVAQSLKLGRHALLHPSERCHTRIRTITAPCGEALTGLGERAPLPIGSIQDQIPLLQKAPRDLELRTNWTGQQGLDLRLLVDRQMRRSSQHEVAMLLKVFAHLANRIPLLPRRRWVTCRHERW